jgi:hypothetical protein
MEPFLRTHLRQVDGLKPGQRKILFACFKRNLKSDIKVSQLAGYIAEHTAYHHGHLHAPFSSSFFVSGKISLAC